MNIDLNKVAVPMNIHFIWIGESVPEVNLYIRVWVKFNPDKKIFLWQDKEASFCDLFHTALFAHVSKKYSDKYEIEYHLANLRNKAFKFIWNDGDMQSGFNQLAMNFLDLHKITYAQSIIYYLEPISDFIKQEEIRMLFIGENETLRKAYYCELILRGNLACASDIIRLMVLKKYGGIYLDVDTLPDLSVNFKETNSYLKKMNLIENESLSILKSAAFLIKFGKGENIQSYLRFFYENISNVDYKTFDHVINLIDQDIRYKDILPSALGDVFVYKGMISLSTLPFIKGVFYSNVICSEVDSRLVKMMLQRIARSYEYLEKNGMLYSIYDIGKFNNERNSFYPTNYRQDYLGNSMYVTKMLTGPDMIVSTLIRYIKKILKTDLKISEKTIIRILQDESIGIGFTKQTLDTPFGLITDWRD